MKYPAIHDSFVTKYKLFRDIVKFSFPSLLYDVNGKIEKSREMNHIRWAHGEYDSRAFLDNTVKYLETRLDVIEERIVNEDPYCYVTFYDSEGKLFASREVKRGEIIDDIPNCVSWVSIFDGWLDPNTGEYLNKDKRIYKDTAYYSQWVGIDLIVQNGLSMTNVNVDNIDVDALEMIVNEIRKRQEGFVESAD